MDFFFIIALTLIASSIGTMTGFGTSTIMVPFLSLYLPLPITLLFVGIIHFFGDIWKMMFFKRGFNWKLILLFGIPGIILSFLAAKLPLTLPEKILQQLLGLFLIFYVVFLLFKPKWKLKTSNASAIVGGSLSGFFAGIFGVGGAIRSTFLSTYNLPKSVFIFTSGAIGLLIDASRITQYFSSGIRLNQNLLIALIFSVPISFLGAYLAKRLVDKIPQNKFRITIAIAILIVGIRYFFIAV